MSELWFALKWRESMHERERALERRIAELKIQNRELTLGADELAYLSKRETFEDHYADGSRGLSGWVDALDAAASKWRATRSRVWITPEDLATIEKGGDPAKMGERAAKVLREAQERAKGDEV